VYPIAVTGSVDPSSPAGPTIGDEAGLTSALPIAPLAAEECVQMIQDGTSRIPRSDGDRTSNIGAQAQFGGPATRATTPAAVNRSQKPAANRSITRSRLIPVLYRPAQADIE
jgi:hypothetical protein